MTGWGPLKASHFCPAANTGRDWNDNGGQALLLRNLFLPQLTFLEGIQAQQNLWASPAVKQRGLQIDITPTVAGLQGMHEYHISFPTWSTVAAFCPASLQHLSFGRGSNEVHMGCQVGKVYRLVLQSGEGVHAVLAILLAFATQARKKSSQKGEESNYDRVRRQSSPRAWDVALVPFPGDFAPLPTLIETGFAHETKWEFPPSLPFLESRTIRFQLIALAEVGDTVTADHLVQMATMPAEHKPTALGVPAHLPVPYHLECARAMLQSLHSLFALLATGDTLTYCPQAADFAKALSTAHG